MQNESKSKYLVFFISLFIVLSLSLSAGQENKTGNKLPVKLEELTSPDFVKAVDLAAGVCVLPMGILEKHGPHLPLGTDMLDARQIALRAAQKEYTIIFPEYYFGKIYEAKHQPGTISYSPELIWQLLQETCNELARNGLKKIIILNGHGGNTYWLNYFCQSQLAEKKDYAVVLFSSEWDSVVAKKVQELRKTTTGGHAGETETSMVMSHRPELIKIEDARNQSGENLQRLDQIPYIFTGIWWYARYPNHYAGDGSHADKEIGELLLNKDADQLVKLIQTLKKDDSILNLQSEFYQKAENPLKTKQ